MNIKETVEEVHNCAKEKGFWDKEPNIPGLLMLCVSELAEAMESDRKDKLANIGTFEINVKLGGEFKENFEEYIKDSFEDELADTIIRIFDICGGLNINIEKHIELKMKYNQMRSFMNGGKKY